MTKDQGKILYATRFFFFYIKLGEGASSKSSKFLILHPMSDIVLNISSFFNFEHNTKT